MRLRHLEKNLLQVLNEAKGRILDDDTVISSLETLKEEAAEVSKKVEETDEVMKEIEMTSQQYMVRCIFDKTRIKSSPAGLVLEFKIWRLKGITDLINL